MSAFGNDNTPFFILGCVRSGTTMLRDILRLHPRLECPEETHFFRWPDPFGSPAYENRSKIKLLRDHREKDGVTEEAFEQIRDAAADRKGLADGYGARYLEAVNNAGGRWFDKTPQNVYGLLLLNHFYPTAKIIHLYRNPLNVVASLRTGAVMQKHSLRGAINYWMESMILLDQFKKIPGVAAKLMEVSYEDVVTDPKTHIASLLQFLGEDPARLDSSKLATLPERHKYKKVLSRAEIDEVKAGCEPFYSNYGYRLD